MNIYFVVCSDQIALLTYNLRKHFYFLSKFFTSGVYFHLTVYLLKSFMFNSVSVLKIALLIYCYLHATLHLIIFSLLKTLTK